MPHTEGNCSENKAANTAPSNITAHNDLAAPNIDKDPSNITAHNKFAAPNIDKDKAQYPGEATKGSEHTSLKTRLPATTWRGAAMQSMQDLHQQHTGAAMQSMQDLYQHHTPP